MKQLLITQEETPASPYRALATQYGWHIHFRPFIKTTPLLDTPFDIQHISTHDALIFTSARAWDYFFRRLKAQKASLPATMNYFCISQAVAQPIQQHLRVPSTHLHIGSGDAQSLLRVLARYPRWRFLYPCGRARMDTLPLFFRQHAIPCTELHLYDTQAADVSALPMDTYDMVVFFSPSAVQALALYHQDLIQGDSCFIAFGNTTAHALKKAGWTPNLIPPTTTIAALTNTLTQSMTQLKRIK